MSKEETTPAAKKPPAPAAPLPPKWDRLDLICEIQIGAYYADCYRAGQNCDQITIEDGWIVVRQANNVAAIHHAQARALSSKADVA
jgi:hypothetical protein